MTTVQRLTVTGQHSDRYNNIVPEYTPVDVPGAIYAPGASDVDPQTGRVTLTDEPTLYLLPGTPVALEDRFLINGHTYTVDSEPAVWDSPWNPAAHRGIVVRLNREQFTAR